MFRSKHGLTIFARTALRGGMLVACIGTLAAARAAKAADSLSAMPVKAAPAAPAAPAYDWTGLYFGGHSGLNRGGASATAFDALAPAASNTFGGPDAGAQLGYNRVFRSGLLLGWEADVTFPNFIRSNAIVASAASAGSVVTEELDYVASARGRVGYAFAPWMVYATGGFALAGSRFLNDLPSSQEEKVLRARPGAMVGGGVEYAFAPAWTARLEYLYSRFAGADVTFPSGTHYASNFDFQEVRVGLNRKLDGPKVDPWGDAKDTAPESDSSWWQIHGQTTYIQQGYPSFRSPYEGTNSLSGAAQTRNTASATAYLGVRAWEGGEIYYAPEIDQGFGLSNTTGAAGFPNGEAQKAGFPYPRYDTTRLFVRQTFGLGGEQETLEDDQDQLGGKVDVSRITVTAGRIALLDFVNKNTYADDSRKTFMNWALWSAGAYDFPADQPGYSWGALVELNQKSWAVRTGYLLALAEASSNNYDPRVFERGEYLVEFESRYSLFSHPGKLRLLGWINSALMGSYRETLDDPSLNLDIAQTREGRIKYGYVVNLEQSLTDEIGLFGRWSWNDGKTEITAFSDIDASLAMGLSIKGKSWGRPDDTIGIAGAVNALSADHRDFIAAGGLGILIGDGQLNYAQEKILETYYSLNVMKSTWLTFDYQLIVDPAYNADRGPVSVFSGRLHAEF